jgi:diguanylate cyclase (GGDEF)-like protein/PAS domain S-box-containing protein
MDAGHTTTVGRKTAALRETLSVFNERDFEDLALQASLICRTPIGAVLILEDGRPLFKSVVACPPIDLAPFLTLCAEAIGSAEVFELRDSAIWNGSGIVFLAGAPLFDENRHSIGAICVFDREKRILSPDQRRAVSALAHQMMERVQLYWDATEAIALLDEAKSVESVSSTPIKNLQDLMDDLPTVAYVKNEQEHVVYGNSLMFAASGLKAEEMLNKTNQELWGEDGRQMSENDRQVLAEKRMIVFEEKTHEKDERHWMSLKFPVPGDNGKNLVAGISFDITKFKRHEHEMEEYRQRLERSLQRLQRLSSTDPLTQLGNRAAFDKALRRAFAESVSDNSPLSLLLLDIDRFKRINDTFGHGLGDEVLRRLGRFIERNVRTGDLAARWGGEEFTLLLPNVNEQEALLFAERLRQGIEQAEWPGCRVTASFGISFRTSDTSSPEELFKSADAALYRAKQAGRNRVAS